MDERDQFVEGGIVALSPGEKQSGDALGLERYAPIMPLLREKPHIFGRPGRPGVL
jgi:hypothetical protein